MARKIYFLATLFASVIIVASFHAAAEDPPKLAQCGPKDKQVKALEWYGEKLRHSRSTPNANYEFYISPETGTWTLLATDKQGMSCVVAIGNNSLQA